MRHYRSIPIIPATLFALGAGCTQGQAPPGTVVPVVSPPATEPAVVSTGAANISAVQIRSEAAAQLTLSTPEGVPLNIRRTSQERIGEAGVAWHGVVVGDPAGSATIVENRDAVAGVVFTSRGTYELKGSGSNIRISRIDQSRFPPEAEPIPRAGRRDNSADPSLDTCATDSGDNIDVMVLYSDDARAAAGSVAAMEAEVYLAVAVSNQSYANSNVTQRLRLVHTAELSYVESGVSTTDLNALETNASVLALRNSFAADEVSLIVQTLDYCGRGNIMTSVGNAFESSAYAVINRGCSSANLSFPHELGHNMSLRHDWATDGTDNSPYHFNHGLRVAGTWRTVMAYPCSGTNCPRITQFSNPNVSVGGIATGSSSEPQPTDNSQVLNTTALTIANFRCSSPGRTDVWMKDTWTDTGAEPDPLTAGQPMWESPYIWIRNSQDAGLFHQHEHQNPEFGSPNWAYVKVHNGGASSSGTMHLYAANASTGLAWPTNFTEIGSVPVTIGAHSTQVVEIPWPTLPGTGHYCLVARWVSTTDPMHAEGTDINANTIANNNVVWRNVNIVDMSMDADETLDVRVRNPDRQRPVMTSLRLVLPPNANGQTFANVGEIAVTLDPRLLRAQRSGNAILDAIIRNKGRWQMERGAEQAEIPGLLLPPGAEGVVKISIRRAPNVRPGDVYRLRIEQWDASVDGARSAQPGRLVGGVTYDISTGKRQAYFAPRSTK